MIKAMGGKEIRALKAKRRKGERRKGGKSVSKSDQVTKVTKND